MIKQSDTQSGVPNASGVIPAGSTVTFTLWMKKTASAGTMFPRAKLNLNSATGASLCTATGSSALTTALTQYSFSCNTGPAVTMAATDRFYLWTGVNLTVGPGSSSVYAELDIEGSLNGNYDSQIVVPLPIPPPSVTSLDPNSGEIGTLVTISGSNFGATQSSTVTFNGTAAGPTSWSASSIATPVPFGATTGSVVVTVIGVPSNGGNFTSVVGTVSGSVTRASDGLGVGGALVEVLQGAAVKASGTIGGSGAYSISGLATGSYDIRASALGYLTVGHERGIGDRRVHVGRKPGLESACAHPATHMMS